MPPGSDQWTILVYMAADNNLEPVAIEDINEMEAAGSNPGVNIVVQFDRNTGYDRSNGDWTDTRRYLITPDVEYNEEIVSTRLDGSNPLGELAMSNPETLHDFIEWGIDAYPADRYMLVMWDHGTGVLRESGEIASRGTVGSATRGVCSDYLDGGELKLWQMDSVLDGLGVHFDIIGFDVCWLGHMETAYQLMDNADFLIASSDEEPDKGWDYRTALGPMLSDPLMSSRNLSSGIVDAFRNQYDDDNRLQFYTQAAVDLQKFQDSMPLFEDFCSDLVSSLPENTDLLESIRSDTDHPRAKPKSRDIIDFADRVSKEGPVDPPSLSINAAALVEAFLPTGGGVIINSVAGDDHPRGFGLAVHFPLDPPPFIYENNLEMSATPWFEFLNQFTNPLSIDHQAMEISEDLDGPWTVTAQVAGSYDPANAFLVYRTSMKGATDHQLTLEESSGGILSASIPGPLSANTTVYYHMMIRTNEGDWAYSPPDTNPLDTSTWHSFLVGPDLVPPHISHFPSGDTFDSVGPYPIKAYIEDNIGVDTASVALHYRKAGETNFTQTAMTPTSVPYEYVGDIPGFGKDAGIHYYITARDTSNARNQGRDPPGTSVYTFDINTPPGTVVILGSKLANGSLGELLTRYFNIRVLEGPITTGTFTPDDKVLVMDGPHSPLGPGEIAELTGFIQGNGELLALAGPNATRLNPIISLAGIEASANLSGSPLSPRDHELTQGIDKITENDGSPILSVNDDVDVLVECDEGPVVATGFVQGGFGRVAVAGRSLFEEPAMAKAGSDNGLLASNMAWFLVRNLPPECIITGNTSVEVGKKFVLSGKDSHDPDGEIINSSWSLHINGKVYTGWGTELRLAVKETGSGTVNLTVTDAEGGTATSVIPIYVGSPPTAVFSASSLDVITGEVIHFDATSSSDNGDAGSIVEYVWILDNYNFAFGPNTSFNYSDDGEYTVVLQVTDNIGLSSFTSQTITVSNRPPIVRIWDGSVLINDEPKIPTDNRLEIVEGDVLHLDTSACDDLDSLSEDPGDRVLNARWFVDGELYDTGSSVNVVLSSPGTYELTLVAQDDDGEEGNSTMELVVTNRPPVALGGIVSSRGRTVTLSAALSEDTPNDVDNLSFSWDLGDGNEAEGAEVEHTYKESGIYNVILRVTDDNGDSDSTVVVVDIPGKDRTTILLWAKGLALVIAIMALVLIVLRFIWVRGAPEDDAGAASSSFPMEKQSVKPLSGPASKTSNPVLKKPGAKKPLAKKKEKHKKVTGSGT